MRTGIVALRSKPGDLWQCGRHHVLCGDATNLDDLHRLLGDSSISMIVADPPYGIAVVPKKGTIGKGSHRYRQIIGDQSTETAIAAHQLCQSLFPDATQVWWGANYYADSVAPSRCWLIWDKEISAKSFADAELAWTNCQGSVRIFKHQWNGAVRASERGVPRWHPAQKPIALASWIYERYGNDQDLIFDPFLGAGSTLLAAESMPDRRLFGMEIDPYYVDVVIARYEAATGNKAKKINEDQAPLLMAA